jgi:hypothetical protein
MIIGCLILGVIAIIGFMVGVLIKIFKPCIGVVAFVAVLSIVGVFLLGLISVASFIFW